MVWWIVFLLAKIWLSTNLQNFWQKMLDFCIKYAKLYTIKPSSFF